MSSCPFATRRGLLGAAVGLAGAIGTGAASASSQPPEDWPLAFHGPHQNGIATPVQMHTYFAAFDATTTKVGDIAALMRSWTDAAARLTRDLSRSRLTITVGFGPGLFDKDGKDRFGLAKHRPEAFVDLPRFVGDQLVVPRTGGDFSVQACGDDPQVTMDAVRQFMRLAVGVAVVRWVQTGFVPGHDSGVTPRNLMGFKDGTSNIDVSDRKMLDQFVWVQDEGGPWMKGGSYVVARPIRIAIEHWDQMKLAFQEQTVGRAKMSGAPIGGRREFDPADFDAKDADGNPTVAENAHIRLAAPANNDGARILRRGYSYDNGVSMVAERWPPWRHAMEMDAGLLFLCYQRDPRTGFIRIFNRMSKFDMLNQFVTHVGGGLFACPHGVAKGDYLGQDLFEA